MISLYVGSAEGYVQFLALLCWVFSHLGNLEYLRANLLQIELFRLWKEKGHPIWDLFKESPQDFLELEGEISLSRLTTFSQKTQAHHSAIKCNQCYLKLKSMSQTASNYRESIKPMGYKVRHKQWKRTDPVVQKLAIYFRTALLQSKVNVLQQYPSLGPSHRHYLPKKDVPVEPFEGNPKFSALSRKTLLQQIEKAKHLFFVQNISGLPQFPKVRSPSNSDEDIPDIPGRMDEFLSGFSIKQVLDHRIKTSGEVELQVVGLYDEDNSSRWLSLAQIGSGIQIAEQYLMENDLEP